MSDQKRGIKGRVYLTSEEVSRAAQAFGCDRFIYNHLLEFEQKRYATDQTKTNKKDRDVELNRLKQQFPWLYDVNAGDAPAVQEEAGYSVGQFLRHLQDHEALEASEVQEENRPAVSPVHERLVHVRERRAHTLQNWRAPNTLVPPSKGRAIFRGVEHDALGQVLCFVPGGATAACCWFCRELCNIGGLEHQDMQLF